MIKIAKESTEWTVYPGSDECKTHVLKMASGYFSMHIKSAVKDFKVNMRQTKPKNQTRHTLKVNHL